MNFGDVIPAGYIVSVISWENDGDLSNIRMMKGLTRDQARFSVMVAQLFRSRRPKGYGNKGMDLLYVLEDLADILAKFDDPNELINFMGFNPVLPDEDDFEDPSDFESKADELGDTLYYWLCDNLLGYSEYYDEQWFCRVASEITVHYNETEVVLPNPKEILVSELVK